MMNQPTQPESLRLRALRNLANNLPVANSQVAAGQQAARDMQLQQAIRQAPTSAPVTSSAQQTGAGLAGMAGQQAVANAQQVGQQANAVAQLGNQQMQQQAQSNTASLQSGARQQQMNNLQRLASVSEAAKQDLYDKQMQFTRDEAGRVLFNERQLADYAKLNARNDQQFQNYAQDAKLLNQRRMEMMQIAYSKINQDLEAKQQMAIQNKDQAQLEKIAKMKADADAAMRREQARAANKQAAWQAGGTIIGAAAGGAMGGPIGAMAGAGVGGAIGGLAGGAL